MPDENQRSSVDAEELNQKLAVKLPKSSRETWSRKVYVYKEDSKRNLKEVHDTNVQLTSKPPGFPPFAMFAEHVQREASIVSQPVVGRTC